MEGKAKKRLAWLPDGVKDAVRPAYVMLLRILRIPSHIRQVGLRRTLHEANPVRVIARSMVERRVNRRHALVEKDVLGQLEGGRLSCLEKFGVVAEKGTLTDDERRMQESASESWQTTFSILVPLYNTPPRFLAELLFSVVEQTYPRWELCLVDASDGEHGEVERIVSFFAAKDKRVCYHRLDGNDGNRRQPICEKRLPSLRCHNW